MTVLLAANCCSAAPGNYWYGGFSLGADDWQNSKTLSAKMTSGPSSGQRVPLKAQSATQLAFTGGAIIGAEQDSDNVMFAEQLELSYQTVNNAVTATLASSSFSNNIIETMGPSAAVALLPGLILTRHVALYGKLGYIVSQFETSGKNPGTLGPNGDQIDYISGLELGIGIQRHFPKRWTLRVEYDYTSYGNFSITGKNDAGIPGGAGGMVTTKYAINTNALMLNAIYSF